MGENIKQAMLLKILVEYTRGIDRESMLNRLLAIISSSPSTQEVRRGRERHIS